MATTRTRTVLLAGTLLLAGANHCLALDSARAEDDQPYTKRRISFEAPAVLLTPVGSRAETKVDPDWFAVMMVHGLSVAGDLVTSRRAFENGAVEANPLYDWAGNNTALALRAATGFSLAYSLNRVNKTHPRLARRVIWSAIFLNIAVSAHNSRLDR